MFAASRKGLLPNPKIDELRLIVLSFYGRGEEGASRVVLAVEGRRGVRLGGFPGQSVKATVTVATERELVSAFLAVMLFLDADLIWAYENRKWGLQFIKGRLTH